MPGLSKVNYRVYCRGVQQGDPAGVPGRRVRLAAPVACRQGAEEGSTGAACCHGPISQAQFLEGLGIRERLQALLEGAALDEEGEALISGYKRLVGGAEAAAVHAEVTLYTCPCERSQSLESLSWAFSCGSEAHPPC